MPREAEPGSCADCRDQIGSVASLLYYPAVKKPALQKDSFLFGPARAAPSGNSLLGTHLNSFSDQPARRGSTAENSD
jgi:hypothetical protein